MKHDISLISIIFQFQYGHSSKSRHYYYHSGHPSFIHPEIPELYSASKPLDYLYYDYTKISDKQILWGESSPNQQLNNITSEASETENSRPSISTSLDEKSSPQYTLVNESFISIIVIYFIEFVNLKNVFLISLSRNFF